MSYDGISLCYDDTLSSCGNFSLYGIGADLEFFKRRGANKKRGIADENFWEKTYVYIHSKPCSMETRILQSPGRR